MAKIECTWGPAETPVSGHTYRFEKDEAGRYVATVHNDDHLAILLSVEHYRLVDDDAPAAAVTPARAAEPEADTITAEDAGTIEALGIVEPAADTAQHPLDHDGDGRPGGSLPKNPPLANDDVTRISGIGPGLKTRLHEEAGITSLLEIAVLTPEQVAVLDEKLKLHGRIARDQWVEKAKAIVDGA